MLNSNLPRKAFAICEADEYPQMVKKLSQAGINSPHARYIVVNNMGIEEILHKIQTYFEDHRVTDFFISAATLLEDRDLLVMVRAFCHDLGVNFKILDPNKKYSGLNLE